MSWRRLRKPLKATRHAMDLPLPLLPPELVTELDTVKTTRDHLGALPRSGES